MSVYLCHQNVSTLMVGSSWHLPGSKRYALNTHLLIEYSPTSAWGCREAFSREMTFGLGLFQELCPHHIYYSASLLQECAKCFLVCLSHHNPEISLRMRATFISLCPNVSLSQCMLVWLNCLIWEGDMQGHREDGFKGGTAPKLKRKTTLLFYLLGQVLLFRSWRSVELLCLAVNNQPFHCKGWQGSSTL